jgi:hypothetical protein
MGDFMTQSALDAFKGMSAAIDELGKSMRVFVHAAGISPDIMVTPTTKGPDMGKVFYGLYFTSTRRFPAIASSPFCAYREWAVTPIIQELVNDSGQSGRWLPAQVWTRYVSHDKHRPIWRVAYRSSPQPTYDDALRQTAAALSTVKNRLGQHLQQTENTPETGWDVINPVVVELTADEARAGWSKTPYPILKRARKVLDARAKAEAAAPESAMFTGAFPPYIAPPAMPTGLAPGA